MKKSVKLGRARGRIPAPASKSVAQRVLALALLAPGSGVFENLGYSADVLAAQSVVQAMGVRLEEREPGVHHVQSNGRIPGNREVDCGESGLSLRMFAPLAALADGPVTLNASGGLLRRPVDMLGSLKDFGVAVSMSGGLPPVRVMGPLKASRADVEGHRTSQFITGLIMALTQCEGDSRLDFSRGRLSSRPYVELTLDCMNRFGLGAELKDEFCFIPGGQRAEMPVRLKVDGDWSGAAFWLVAGALSGPVTVAGLTRGSGQADEAICLALAASGADLTWRSDGLSVKAGARKAFYFDASHCPDLFPPLAVLAAASSGRSEIRGLSRLAIKECDRGQALADMLESLGGRVSFDRSRDIFQVDGRPLRGGSVQCHGDHRMVMAAAIASLLTEGPIEVDDVRCVAKSYPDFFSHAQILGG